MTERFCPECGETAEKRGQLCGLPAPMGWYRCPSCEWSTACHLLPRRSALNIAKMGPPPRP